MGSSAYGWNVRDQLISTSDGNATFSYDALGRRVGSTISGASSTYQYDGLNPVMVNGSLMLEGLGLDQHFGRINSGGVTSFLTDDQGSTLELTNSSAATSATYAYGPYGNASASGSDSTPFQYTGRENDGATNLYYYRARYYNPTIGRFISSDPLVLGGGINPYAYVGGDPISRFDPLGLAAYLNLINATTPSQVALYDWAQSYQPAEYNVIFVHGGSDGQYSPNAVGNSTISPEALADLLKHWPGYDPNLPTQLVACGAGAHPTSVQRLANALNALVLASPQTLSSNPTPGGPPLAPVDIPSSWGGPLRRLYCVYAFPLGAVQAALIASGVKLKKLAATLVVTAILVVTMVGVYEFRTPSKSQVVTLCATTEGPAFIGFDDSRKAVAVHAGLSRGVSFISLETGQLVAEISIPRRFLAASMAQDAKELKVATLDASGISILRFDVAAGKETYVQPYPILAVDLAAFTPDGDSLVGVTAEGTVFKVSIDAKRLDTRAGAAPAAQAIAVSADGRRLYVASKGITEIDIPSLRVLSVVARKSLLTGIAVSPDNGLLAVRDLHSLEILDAASKSEIGDPLAEDVAPDAASATSPNIVFSPDGSQLFYVRAGAVTSQLRSLSVRPLGSGSQATVGPYASAMGISPFRQAILLTTGGPDKEMLEAYDMKTLALKFQLAVPDGSRHAESHRKGCVRSAD